MTAGTENDYRFSFEELRRIDGNAKSDTEYLFWFCKQAVDKAGEAMENIQQIRNMEWDKLGEDVDVGRLLKNSWAVLNGLRDNLHDAVGFFHAKNSIRFHVWHALKDVNSCLIAAKPDYQAALKFVDAPADAPSIEGSEHPNV